MTVNEKAIRTHMKETLARALKTDSPEQWYLGYVTAIDNGASHKQAIEFADHFVKRARVENIFCPTGKGGGVDPTCKKGEARGSGHFSSERASELLRRIKEEGGFTYQPVNNTTPKEGFAVSTFKNHERVFDADKITLDDIADYVLERWDQFKDPKVHVGGWVDQGKVYLDLSTVVKSRDEAIRLGKRHNQLAVFDLGRLETIYLQKQTQNVGGASNGKTQNANGQTGGNGFGSGGSLFSRLIQSRDWEGTDGGASEGASEENKGQTWPEAEGTRQLTAHVFCPTGKGGGIDPTCRPKGKTAVRRKKDTARSKRAKLAYNPSTKEKQDVGRAFERELSAAFNLRHLGDNEPLDLVTHDGMVGLEVKTVNDGKENKVHMRRDSRVRKEAWIAERPGRRAFTIIMDNRDKFQGGKHKKYYSGHRYWWKEGVGAFRFNNMFWADSLEQLRAQIKEVTGVEL